MWLCEDIFNTDSPFWPYVQTFSIRQLDQSNFRCEIPLLCFLTLRQSVLISQGFRSQSACFADWEAGCTRGVKLWQSKMWLILEEVQNEEAISRLQRMSAAQACAAQVSLLSRPRCVITLSEEQKTQPQTFQETHVLTWLLTSFGRSLDHDLISCLV